MMIILLDKVSDFYVIFELLRITFIVILLFSRKYTLDLTGVARVLSQEDFIMATEIVLIPKLSKDANKDDFRAWKNEFLTFIDLLVDDADLDVKGLKYLKYAVAGARLSIDFDGKTTFKSALEKVKKTFLCINDTPFPLHDFMQLKWSNQNCTITAYVEKLRGMLTFISNKTSKDEIIKQHILEELSPELQILFRKQTLSDILQELPKLSKESIFGPSVSAVHTNTTYIPSRQRLGSCFNCSHRGHISRNCRQKKQKCSSCLKEGHLSQFCDQVSKLSKNVFPVISSVERDGPIQQ